MDSFDYLILAVGLGAAGGAAWLAVAEAVLTTLPAAWVEAVAAEEDRAATSIAARLRRREVSTGRVAFARLLLLAVAVAAPVLLSSELGTGAAVAVFLVAVVLLYALTAALPRIWVARRPERALGVADAAARWIGGFPPLRLVADLSTATARRLAPARQRNGLPLGPPFDDAEGGGDETSGEGADASGQGGDTTSELLTSVVEFAHTLVREIMVPRTDMITLPVDLAIDEACVVAGDHGFSRFPVESESLDDIVGLVYTKDLMRAALAGRGADVVATLMHEPPFVPETKRASDLLRDMQRNKVHLAVVVDEYGGTAGLITLEDVLEELVGDIADEFDEEEPPVVERLPDGRIRLTASALVTDANHHLRRPLPEGDWDTVGGLVFDLFGRVPEPGEVTELNGVQLEVEGVAGRRIESVLMSEPVP